MINIRRNFLHIFILIAILIAYLLVLSSKHPEIFSYKFNTSLIDRYLCSQDITNEPPCNRLFLSDGDLHIAAGYLYINGKDPTEYHFQHTPFIKYLYGLTIVITNNPFYLEIFFGIIYLFLTYLLTYKIFKSKLVAFLTTLFLIFDPLLISLSGDASFELGQACFLLAYIFVILYKKENYFLQGLLLGLFASSKFWGAVPFFVLILNGYQIIKKRLKLKTFLLQLLFGFIIFSLTYLKTFINQNGLFNIFFFQLKLLKYWIDHSVTNVPFASISLFFVGFYKSWWGSGSIIKSNVWTIIWPISSAFTIFRLVFLLTKRKINKEVLIAFIPVTYLFYLGIKAPFVRYFILILPFFYMTFINIIIRKIKSIF